MLIVVLPCRDLDFDVAYALTSPVGRAVAGTRERFRAAMQVGGDMLLLLLLLLQFSVEFGWCFSINWCCSSSDTAVTLVA
jgi:hypothetical protein